MTGRVRLLVFAVGAAGFAVLFGLAVVHLPVFGGVVHPYRDAAVRAALAQVTPNVVSSINFDQRGLDTFGEETILLVSVLGAATLLRPGEDERPRRAPDPGQLLLGTRLAGYLLLPVTALVGADVVVHGHLTPGGGFQGGVILATGLHLLYVAGSYPALRRLRPLAWYDLGEATGMGAVVALGAAGLFAGAGFLANVLPKGEFGSLLSAGSVPLFSIAVGIAVGSGVVVLLAQFLEQALGLGAVPVTAVSAFAYGVGGWLMLAGICGVVRSRHLVHSVVCVAVAQSGTYVFLLVIGYQRGASAPIFGSSTKPGTPVVDPVVQAMTLTDVVVSATVTALLLALVVQVAKRHGTVDPDELHELRG